MDVGTVWQRVPSSWGDETDRHCFQHGPGLHHFNAQHSCCVASGAAHGWPDLQAGAKLQAMRLVLCKPSSYTTTGSVFRTLPLVLMHKGARARAPRRGFVFGRVKRVPCPALPCPACRLASTFFLRLSPACRPLRPWLTSRS